MLFEFLHSKIHRATITDSNLNYVGSITIDEEFLEKSNIREWEKVEILDINNGERFQTYAIKGVRGSKCFCVNGAAARKVQAGDKIIIVTYAQMTEEEIVRSYKEAAYKGSQIGILADLNECNPSEIHAILEKHGIDITKPENKKSKCGRPAGAIKSKNKPQSNKVLTEVDQKLIALLNEGISTIDVEIKKYQQIIDDLNNKKQAFIKFQEDIKED